MESSRTIAAQLQVGPRKVVAGRDSPPIGAFRGDHFDATRRGHPIRDHRLFQLNFAGHEWRLIPSLVRSNSPIPTIPTLRTIRAYRFFFEHAGYIVGRRAECALSLAKAEQWANDQGLEFVTEPDCDADLSFADTWPARERDEFKKQDHEVICARLVRPCEDHGTECRHAETLASLGGIVDADNAYLRVIRAELASEAQGGN